MCSFYKILIKNFSFLNMTEVDRSVDGQTEKNEHEKVSAKTAFLILFIRINRHTSFQGNIA